METELQAEREGAARVAASHEAQVGGWVGGAGHPGQTAIAWRRHSEQDFADATVPPSFEKS